MFLFHPNGTERYGATAAGVTETMSSAGGKGGGVAESPEENLTWQHSPFTSLNSLSTRLRMNSHMTPSFSSCNSHVPSASRHWPFTSQYQLLTLDLVQAPSPQQHPPFPPSIDTTASLVHPGCRGSHVWLGNIQMIEPFRQSLDLLPLRAAAFNMGWLWIKSSSNTVNYSWSKLKSPPGRCFSVEMMNGWIMFLSFYYTIRSVATETRKFTISFLRQWWEYDLKVSSAASLCCVAGYSMIKCPDGVDKTH